MNKQAGNALRFYEANVSAPHPRLPLGTREAGPKGLKGFERSKFRSTMKSAANPLRHLLTQMPPPLIVQGTTRQQSRKSAAPRIRQRRIIQEHRGKNAQIEPGTCPPMQSRPECTLRPAFLIFPQGYSSPSSGSATRIRPQYSQTISFLPWRISTWRCGGIRLKQPPQASRFTVTTASPLRTLLRMRP